MNHFLPQSASAVTASAAAIMDAAQRLWSHLAERGTECVDEFDSGDAQAMFVSKGLWHLVTHLIPGCIGSGSD